MRYLLLSILLFGCGSVGHNLSEAGKCVNNGEGCHASQAQEGQKGPQGVQGEQGATGSSGRDGAQGNSGSPGPRGSQGERGDTGNTGPQGAPGTNGTNGSNGTSCTVSQANNGALITCGNTSIVVLNGVDGTNGTDGHDGADAPPTAYSVTEMYNPCGDNSGYDEVLLHLANGEWVAHYAGGGNVQFLTVLTPGSYVTTDQSPCYFTLNANGTISGEHL